jgi:hypothetical protein
MSDSEEHSLSNMKDQSQEHSDDESSNSVGSEEEKRKKHPENYD